MLPAKLPLILALLLTAIGVGRIAATYRAISQTSDESSNLACGFQWLEQGRYDLGPFHPPLARIAMSVGPYLYGARSQGLTDRWKEGNAVLSSGARYAKTLTLARIGILPFFVLASLCVWLWSRRLLGEWGGVAAVFLFTNIPPVLAHAGVATSDMAICAGVCAAAYAFVRWVDEPDLRGSLLLGVAFAVAFLSKFSSVVLLPASAVTILLLRWAGFRPAHRRILIALLVAALLTWSAYRFSFGRMTEHVAADAAGQGGIWSAIPASWFHTLERAPLPAPEILDGFWQVHNHVDGGQAAYLLGENSMRGWWYFFPVALAVKTPLGLLILTAIGFFALAREKLRPFDWRAWAPAALLLAALAGLPALHAEYRSALRFAAVPDDGDYGRDRRDVSVPPQAGSGARDWPDAVDRGLIISRASRLPGLLQRNRRQPAGAVSGGFRPRLGSGHEATGCRA